MCVVPSQYDSSLPWLGHPRQADLWPVKAGAGACRACSLHRSDIPRSSRIGPGRMIMGSGTLATTVELSTSSATNSERPGSGGDLWLEDCAAGATGLLRRDSHILPRQRVRAVAPRTNYVVRLLYIRHFWRIYNRNRRPWPWHHWPWF